MTTNGGPGALADFVREQRLSAGLSQEGLAERAGLSVQTVGALERGLRRRLYPQTIHTLAEALALGDAERAALAELASGRARDADGLRHPPAAAPPAEPSRTLPVPLTNIVGRERELTAVALLLAGGTRLLTLTGAGGAGKTRLAVEVARTVGHNFPDGVWFVDLAPLTDSHLVSQTVARALGLVETPGRSSTEQIVAALGERRTLLVLDNCEHLVVACAELVAALLRNCAGLTIVATSREPLAVTGEQVYPVPPLPLPPADVPAATTEEVAALAEFAAVRLFFERAQAVRPDFGLTAANAPAVIEICRRLDGLPLAIELAAARVRVLNPEQIAVRLDDRFRLLTGGSRTAPSRQQTLGATIAWSHGLLSGPERALLRRLAVFAGGWSLEAAEAICIGGEVAADTVLDLLTALVDKSLVAIEQRDETARYRLLESIREYAAVRMAESGEAARVRRRHRDWYWALAERAAAGPLGRRQARWMPRLAEEHDNLRAAIEWSLTDGQDPAGGLAIVCALQPFWLYRHLLRESLTWYSRALAATGTAVPELRVMALLQMANAAWLVVDPATGLPAAREALDLAREIVQGWATVRALRVLALNTAFTGDSATGIALLEQALAQVRLLRDGQLLPLVLNSLGFLTLGQGALAGARALLLEGLQAARAVDSDDQTGFALLLLGYCAFLQSDAAESGARYAEGLAVAMSMEHLPLTSACLAGLALTATVEGRLERAVRLLGAWEVLSGRHGILMSPREQALVEQEREKLRPAMGEPAFVEALAAGRALSLQDALHEALDGAQSPRITVSGGPP